MLQKLEFLGRKDEKILSFESVKYMAHQKMDFFPFLGNNFQDFSTLITF